MALKKIIDPLLHWIVLVQQIIVRTLTMHAGKSPDPDCLQTQDKGLFILMLYVGIQTACRPLKKDFGRYGKCSQS